MRTKRTVFAMTSALVLMTGLSPAAVSAATFPMKHTKIQLNATALSTPSGFASANTTYMPLFYVQQLLNKLGLQNTWDGTTWKIATAFSAQPSFALKTVNGNMSIEVNGKSFAGHVNKIVTTDPASKQETTFIPIWYIMQTLKAIGLESTWNGAAWTVEANYTDVSKLNKPLGSFTRLADAQTALLDYPGGMVKDGAGQVLFTEVSFKNVDLRYPAPVNINATSLNGYFSQCHSIMTGLGQVFMDAQSRYGVDANYLVSHAMEETGSGGNVSDIAINKNNLYGYGAFDANATSDAGVFPSEGYAILFQAWEVRNNYLNPSSSHFVAPTLAGMAANYASDPQWANKVNNLMDQLAITMNDNVTSYKQYAATNQSPAPQGSSSIPVYHFNGAKGTVSADTYYGPSVPVYTDGGAGHEHMFVREIKQGDQGNDVQTLQQALNSAENAGLKPDGMFGPSTEAALKAYQSSHGLSPTGICDFNLWNNVLHLSDPSGTVTAGQTISIDGMVEGMAGGQVTEWYHVPNLGWVNAADVTLTNVYRLTVPNPASAADVSVPVTNQAGQTIASLHAGDYVVSANAAGSGGKVQIQFADQGSGSPMSGYVNASAATLTQVH
jgi:beta-N-acetylglucosaminidase/peptidoglycan hydrolase-like protein with peptidoglycan-binding domain